MTRFTSIIAAVCFLLFLTNSAFAQRSAKISEIQARAFNSRTGEFSENLLAAGAPELGNMPSGELASVSTFIIIKIEFGKGSPIPKDAKVRLVATESGSMPFAAKPAKLGKRIILDSSNGLGPVDPDGNTYVGFWLKTTDCRSVALKASLIGLAKTSTMSETLPFTCYE